MPGKKPPLFDQLFIKLRIISRVHTVTISGQVEINRAALVGSVNIMAHRSGARAAGAYRGLATRGHHNANVRAQLGFTLCQFNEYHVER